MNRRVTKRELVIDDFHGTKVADPYRWLEKDASPEVSAWIDEQNGDFQNYINGFGVRKELHSRLTELWHYERSGAPVYVNGVYYVWKNNGLQNQSVLYRLKNLEDSGEVVLDPNTFSSDGTVAVGSHMFSPKGSYLAYGISTSGSDWQEVKVLDLRSGEHLKDVIRHTRFTYFCWLPDETGFFYTRYPEPVKEILERNTLNAFSCLHILGEDQQSDKIIHKDAEHPDYGFGIYTDEDKKWLFMSTWNSTLPVNQLHFKLLEKLDSPWNVISDNFDDCFHVLGVIEDTAIIYTEKDAPFGKIVSLKLSEDSHGEFETIIPDQGMKLENMAIAGNHILCVYLSDVVSKFRLFDKNGGFVKEIELPAPGSIVGISAKQKRDEFFFQFTSYLYPASVFRCDVKDCKPEVWFSPKINFPFGEYESVQEFYHSYDGTKIPIFITKKKSIALDGNNPLLLYGYGGFTNSMSPTFSSQTLAWLERGGIYAVACIRGGAEYGEKWHRAGMLESKQNCFDDFIAAGEYLVERKYTSHKKLAINGRSNGGLLTAACLVQRPDCFGAVVVGVPVIDMLRYHLFTAGRFWVGEYGSAENKEQFPFMYKYSPLHNVKMNAVYPATLIMTADTDDRVVPGQARKFAATLHAADAGENPLLIRIEKSAGHGHGKPIAKLIDEAADFYTFLLANVG